MSKPFLVGDYVIAGGVEGTVLEIGLLNTQINTADNKRISVPNSTISGETITNCSTEGKRRVDLEFSASYEAPGRAGEAGDYGGRFRDGQGAQ